jgi:hypothetical protein
LAENGRAACPVAAIRAAAITESSITTSEGGPHPKSPPCGPLSGSASGAG